MRNQRTIVSGLAGIAVALLAGCSEATSTGVTYAGTDQGRPPARQDKALGPKAKQNAQAPKSLGQLRGRRDTVTMFSTPDGPRYRVISAEGKVLADKLSLEQLRAEHPELAQRLDSTYADSEGLLDARLESTAVPRAKLHQDKLDSTPIGVADH